MGHPTKRDVLQDAVGDMGRWQAGISLMMAVLKLPIAWFQLSILILEAPTDHWCTPPDNVTLSEWRDSQPRLPGGAYDECHIRNGTGDTSECQAWRYSDKVFTSTIVSEWDLVCGRAWLADVTQATFMLGVLLGNVLFGMAADRFGRKTPLLGAIAMQAIAGVAASFVPWFEAFIVLRFLVALATGGTMIISFVMVMEVVGDSWRGTVAILYQIPFTLGICVMAGFAYFLRSWRDFQLTLSCISFLFLFYWWFVPESPRWLLAVGRQREAVRILEDGARRNKRDVVAVKDIVESQPVMSDPKLRAGVLDLFRTRRMALNTVALYFNWFVAGLSFFGLSQCMGAMGGDIFVNVSVAGLIGLPGTLGAVYVVRLGRRKSILISQILTGAACLLVITCPKGAFPGDWPRLTLSAVAFTALSLYLPALYLFSGELFPTVVRNAGMGSASMFSRLGSILAPFVKSMGTQEPRGDLWPMVIIGGGPLVAAVVLSFLPETQGRPLPDTLEDGESFNKRRAEDKQNCNYIQVPKQERSEG